MTSTQTGSVGGANILGQFWEEERKRCSNRLEAEDENDTEKRYKATWLNIDQNYGLI